MELTLQRRAAADASNRKESGRLPSVNIVGVRIDPMSFDSAIELMERWISQRQPRKIFFPGSDILAACQGQYLQKILNEADLVATDGMMLVRIARFLGIRYAERVYGPDVMLELCRRSPGKGYSHFFYGGAPGVADALANRMKARYPGLIVSGTYSPPFRPLDEAELVEIAAIINACAPDIIWVGLGTPKQEMWMAEMRKRLRAPLLLGVGAAFDFHSGTIQQAPRWIRESGGEWLFRLCREPRRLWRRYTWQLLQFLTLFASQVFGLRQFPIEQRSEREESLHA